MTANHLETPKMTPMHLGSNWVTRSDFPKHSGLNLDFRIMILITIPMEILITIPMGSPMDFHSLKEKDSDFQIMTRSVILMPKVTNSDFLKPIRSAIPRVTPKLTVKARGFRKATQKAIPKPRDSNSDFRSNFLKVIQMPIRSVTQKVIQRPKDSN